MAVTATRTTTKTFPRLELLKWQVTSALKQTVSLSDKALTNVTLGLDKHWIKKVNMYGLNEKGQACIHLRLEIDWVEHKLQISRGNVTVAIDDRWNNDVALQLSAACDIFSDLVDRNSFKTDWSVSYGANVNQAEANSLLGFKSAVAPCWAGNAAEDTMRNKLLPEIAVTLKISDES